MRISCLSALFLLLASCGGDEALVAIPSRGATEALTPWSSDEKYWSWDGKQPSILLGASNHRAPFLASDGLAELDYLVKTGGNYVRTTLPASKELLAIKVDGHEYQIKKKLEEYLFHAQARRVAVEIELWDYVGVAASPWDSSAWNDYLTTMVGDSVYRRDHLAGEHPFFQTVPASVGYSDDLLPVLRRQEAFVDCLLERTAGFGNVIYDVRVPDNMLIPWMVYWGRYVEKYGERHGRSLNVRTGVAPLRRETVMSFNESVLSGAPLAYHPAPPLGPGMSGRALTSIRGVRVLERHLDLTTLRPAPGLLAENNGRARAATDGRGNYAVYLPTAGDVYLTPDWDDQPTVDVTVIGYLGTQRSEVLEPPYGETFRLYTDEEKGGWLLLRPRGY